MVCSFIYCVCSALFLDPFKETELEPAYHTADVCVFVQGSYRFSFLLLSFLSILKSMEFGTSDSVQVIVAVPINLHIILH